MRVHAVIIDGNAHYSASGTLRRGARGFVIDEKAGGSRVFPLGGRQVEVYLVGGDDIIVRTVNNDVLVDDSGLPAFV